MTGCDGMWEAAKQLKRVQSVRVYPIFLKVLYQEELNGASLHLGLLLLQFELKLSLV